MGRPRVYPDEFRERAVRLVHEWRKERNVAEGGVGGRMLANKGRVLNRQVVERMLNRITKAAGIAHVHPHQLRHTVATQAITGA